MKLLSKMKLEDSRNPESKKKKKNESSMLNNYDLSAPDLW